MKPQIGIWIDPHQAILVTNPEHHADISRVVAAHAPQENAYARASRYQEAATAEAFYDDVVDHLRDASALLLVGPGAAKFDLQERLVAHGLGDLIIGVESTEAMTDCQLVMAVRQYFHEAAVMIC
ncbi:MAG: hypothetical protein J0M33_00075 [Anaerolineae bacterium]|nr:hypothetical protein [Anaerolineae bacterium]